MGLRYVVTESSRVAKTGMQRFSRPVFDYHFKIAPCSFSCPIGQDIPVAIFLVSIGRFDLAKKALMVHNPFPSITGRVCSHPCMDSCNRGGYDSPISIPDIERLIGDIGSGWDPMPGAPTGKSVGIIGSGPAGLSCAYFLLLYGHRVRIYEAEGGLGGALRSSIPSYRLPEHILSSGIGMLERMGADFEVGVRVGRDIGFQELRGMHDAVFIAIGLGAPRFPKFLLDEPRILDNVVFGIDFLKDVKAGRRMVLKKALVIGGGDVAIDSARSAVRLGARDVKVISPERVEEMPAHPDCIREALEEGVRIYGGMVPIGVREGGGGIEVGMAKVRSIRRDGTGEVVIEPEVGATTWEWTEMLVLAVGQRMEGDFLPEEIVDGGKIAIGAWGETAIHGVFAGGDCAGGGNVAMAIASGRRGAIGIDRFLKGLPPLREQKPRVVEMESINLDYFRKAEPVRARTIPFDERIRSFSEIKGSLSPEDAVEEAKRCFSCGMCTMCGNCYIFCPDSAILPKAGGWGFEVDLDHCKGCGVCVEECPHGAISMVLERGYRDGG
jgi:2-oxoacid:acceptor oxidoreductase delta subunit (pyruvate/2-ketoisovalerate family)